MVERSFTYQRRSYEDAKARRDSGSGSFDTYVKKQFKMYKVKDGKNLVRILPPTWDKANHYGYSVWVNYSIGPDNQSYLSLAKMLNKPDPLAEARMDADRNGDEDTAKELAPRERVLMWVIDRENEDDGPMVWAAPKTVDSDILGISTDDDTKELTEIDHHKKGQDLRFYREGKGLNTKYPAAKMRLMTPAPIHEDPKIQQEWLNFIVANPLPEVLQFYDYDHISGVFNGHSKTKDDEGDVKPARKAKAAEPEDDADDEPKPRARPRIEEADDVEDDEPEEKPSKSAKARDGDDEEDLSIQDRIKKFKQKRAAKEADDD